MHCHLMLCCITKVNELAFCQGYYDSSDDGVMDEDGFVSIMARTDDVINVAGHRISTKSLEEVQFKIFVFLSLHIKQLEIKE